MNKQTEFSMNGHAVKVNRVRLWTGAIVGVFTIIAMLWAAFLWAGNREWQTREEAKEVTRSVSGLKTDVKTIKDELAEIGDKLDKFIESSQRSRIEDQINDLNMSIYSLERQIRVDGNDARENDRRQLEMMKSRKEQLLRKLNVIHGRQFDSL